MSYAIVFPGQGAQEIVMGKDFFKEYEVVEIINNVLKISEDALGCFWAEIRNTVLALGCANMRFEHHIKRSRLAQRIVVRAFDAFFHNCTSANLPRIVRSVRD